MRRKEKIKVYGTRWCGDTRRALTILEEYRVPYEFLDIDLDDQCEKVVRKLNKGNRSVPTILFNDGSVLVEPNDYELKTKLTDSGLSFNRTLPEKPKEQNR